MPRRKKEAGVRGDWQAPQSDSSAVPASVSVSFPVPDVDQDIYKSLEGGISPLEAFNKKIEAGEAQVVDAVLFCGRFSHDGNLLRESNVPIYKTAHARNHQDYLLAIKHSKESFSAVKPKISEGLAKENFITSSDLGSTYTPDPNQFTEFTPYFNGPFSKQQYFDYFKGHARAFQEYNHNPVAKRIVDIFVQYAFGRGFQVRCKNDKFTDKWQEFNHDNRITHKLRKYWMREYLIYGENFIDKLRWISVDPSTIYDIVCEGYDEFIDKVLYYQQMFQTATQMYSGLKVDGVPGSADSKIGHYIIRQIPFDQIIHIKGNVMSVEKRGRSILYSVLGWLKRLVDTFNAQVLGEQLRACFVWDDTIKGNQSDVAAHGAKYNYIPVAPSIFVHNESVERKPLAPMTGVPTGASNVVQEILSLIATAVGLPKEHLNVMMNGGGSRATAVVGSEPFTKVIEDLQEDGNDLLHQIIEAFCFQNKLEYNSEDWQVIFPSVQKDALNDRLKAIATCEAMGYFSKPRAASMAAAEMEADDYDYDSEVERDAKDKADRLAKGLPGAPTPPPAGRFGAPPPQGGAQGQDGDDAPDNPIHGKGKQKIVDQHKTL